MKIIIILLYVIEVRVQNNIFPGSFIIKVHSYNGEVDASVYKEDWYLTYVQWRGRCACI